MSLFRKAGKKFEETKQAFMVGNDDTFRCESCEHEMDEKSEYCPNCGSSSVIEL